MIHPMPALASLTRHLEDDAHTLAFGRDLGRCLTPGMVIYLRGDLGAGKTSLARGILRGLDYRNKVKSPTYTLVEAYKVSRLYLYHFDFYRLDEPGAWIDAGFREYFNEQSVCLVEWPERAGDTLPAPDLDITLDIPDVGRDMCIVALSETGRRCLSMLDT
jgi:tRNA threonylcarbamoyladenosine biosynthesis protein TsaE